MFFYNNYYLHIISLLQTLQYSKKSLRFSCEFRSGYIDFKLQKIAFKKVLHVQRNNSPTEDPR